MASSQETPLARHRKRLRTNGVIRLEVRVRKEDAALLRGLAVALNDPDREAKTRASLQDCLLGGRSGRLKALLAGGAPGDLDLSRPRDLGRDVDL